MKRAHIDHSYLEEKKQPKMAQRRKLYLSIYLIENHLVYRSCIEYIVE